jgi:hypothetical protein
MSFRVKDDSDDVFTERYSDSRLEMSDQEIEGEAVLFGVVVRM